MSLSNFIRRILGAGHFPLRNDPIDTVEPQVYQPEPVVKQVIPTPPPTPSP